MLSIHRIEATSLNTFLRLQHSVHFRDSFSLNTRNLRNCFTMDPKASWLRQYRARRDYDTLATLYFCAYLQPMLETIAEEFPEVTVNSLIDDITLASKNTEMLERAFDRLREILTQKSLKLSTGKCVWFGGISNTPIPEALKKDGAQSENEATKILGAFVGEKNNVEKHLFATYEKNTIVSSSEKNGDVKRIAELTQ